MATTGLGGYPVMSKKRIAVLAPILVLLLSLLGLSLTPVSGGAVPEVLRWSRVNIPREGETGGWALAGGSNLRHLAMAGDGTLYVYANPSGTGYTLFKSSDAGKSWSHTGGVRDAIVDIAVAPGNPNMVYYATVSGVYKSGDAGNTFGRFPESPGGAGSGNITIVSLGVGSVDGNNILAVGTSDGDSSQYGGIYTLDESEVVPDWLDTGLTGYDIAEITFSPGYAGDRQILAVVTDEQDTVITSKISNSGWNQLIGNAVIEGVAAQAASIAFPDDYDATTDGHTFFVALDSGSGVGDVYKIEGKGTPESSIARDLDTGAGYGLDNVDIRGLAVSGSGDTAILLAASGSSQVYSSEDGGFTWTRSVKHPTGQSLTGLLMSEDYPGSSRAYAITAGAESAFSYTDDGGISWNQLSLIDTQISAGSITDLAISPDYHRDATLLMLTFDTAHSEHSLWRSLNGGTNWERLFSGVLTGVDTLVKVRYSPEYGDGGYAVYIAGTAYGNPAIWKSKDGGQTYKYRIAPASIDVFEVIDDATLLFGSYNGTDALIYSTTNSGLFYSEGAAAGNMPLWSLALSPGYETDGNILTGSTDGWMYRSADNGSSFNSVPLDAVSPPLAGSISVAFDPEFSSNKIIYAISDAADKGVYRFTIGKSTSWQRIDDTLPAGATLNRMAVSPDGTLYASNARPVDTDGGEGGMERSVNPEYNSGLVFETITAGLDDGALLKGLWAQGNQLWAVDTANTRLMTYIDTLDNRLNLAVPGNNAAGTGTANVILEWQSIDGAEEYKWQFDYDADFSTVPTGFEGETGTNRVRLPALDADTVYHWRVRATKPVLGRWSDVWSFTTGLGSTVVTPQLLSPNAGAEEQTSRPLFQWSPIAGADSYELIVSTDYAFGNPTILKIDEYALPTTAWQSTISLESGTTYYWKVRASNSGNLGAWSAVGAFTTAVPSSQPAAGSDSPAPESSGSAPPQSSETPSPVPPALSSSAPSPSSPEPAPQPAVNDWSLIIIGGLLLAIILLLVILLVLVATIRRSPTA